MKEKKLLLLILLLMACHGLFSIPISDGFDYPVGKPNGVGYNITNGWEWLDWTGAVWHPANDFNGNGGGDTDFDDPIYAASNGTVVAVGNYGSGWGNIVLIEHLLPDGTSIWTQYAHCHNLYVSTGQDVTRGELIATIGKGYNNEYDAHLHFEIRKQYRSPSAWVTGWTQTQILQWYYEPTAFIDSHRELETYSANFHSQADWPTVTPGSLATWWVKFENTGTENWLNVWSDRVRLGTGTYSDRDKDYDIEHSSWESSRRPTTLEETSVSPGNVGTFIFTFQVPSDATPGTTSEAYHFTPLAEGIDWMKMDNGDEIDCFMKYHVVSGRCVSCPNYDHTITSGTSFQTTSSSIISNSCKMYRLSITSGRTYTFKTGCGDGTTANFDTQSYLYNNSCSQVASDDHGCESNRDKIEWTATRIS